MNNSLTAMEYSIFGESVKLLHSFWRCNMNNWKQSYSAHRRPFVKLSPMREWVMAFSIGLFVWGAVVAAFIVKG
jgi:hypothetical protein